MKKPVHFRKFARNRRIERQGAAGISKFLFWGEDLSGSFQGAGGVGGLVAHMEKPDSAGWTAYYYHPDANGNIAAVTSPFRALAAKFSYDAFGRTVTQTGSKSGIDIHALNYRFSTKPMELELATSNSTLVPPPLSSGLYYYGYRFYSPNLGRWISRDPIREQGGRNLYNFVGNNGVDKIDVLGENSFTDWWSKLFSKKEKKDDGCSKKDDIGKIEYVFATVPEIFNTSENFKGSGILKVATKKAAEKILSESAGYISGVGKLSENFQLASTATLFYIKIIGVHRCCKCDKGVIKWTDWETYNQGVEGGFQGGFYLPDMYQEAQNSINEGLKEAALVAAENCKK